MAATQGSWDPPAPKYDAPPLPGARRGGLGVPSQAWSSGPPLPKGGPEGLAVQAFLLHAVPEDDHNVQRH